MNKSVVKPTHKAGIPGHLSPARLHGQVRKIELDQKDNCSKDANELAEH